MNIRPMSKDEAKEVVSLIKNAWKKHYKGILDERFLDNFPEDKFLSGRLDQLEKPEFFSFVVLGDQGEIIGFSDAGKSWESNVNEREGEIYAIYVESENIGKGYGKLLFDHQYNLLKEKGFKRLIIWSLKENKLARDFYERMGGVVSEEREKEVFGSQKLSVKYEWFLEKV